MWTNNKLAYSNCKLFQLIFHPYKQFIKDKLLSPMGCLSCNTNVGSYVKLKKSVKPVLYGHSFSRPHSFHGQFSIYFTLTLNDRFYCTRNLLVNWRIPWGDKLCSKFFIWICDPAKNMQFIILVHINHDILKSAPKLSFKIFVFYQDK